jgi:nucleolar protein 4
LNGTKHHGRTIAVDWALPKNKYLKAVGLQKIGSPYEEMLNSDEEEEDDDNDGDDDEMEQDEDEQEKDYVTSDNETENELNEEMDDSISNMIESGSEDDSDNDSSAIENQFINEESEERANEDESNAIEIHDETSKDVCPLSEGTVLFIRNLSFDATEEELSNM